MSNLVTYGLDVDRFPVVPNQLEIELLHVASNNPEDFGGLSRGEHLKNCIKILYPWWWEKWHEWNEMCLWAWLNYEEITMTGCASAHKTFTFSGLSFIEWLAKPTKTSVILTSTSIASLRGRIWNEIKKFYEEGVIPFNYNVVDSEQKIRSTKGDDKFAIRALPVDTGQVEKAVGKIQGIHPERMILVVDEAAQTPEAVFTARANLKVGTEFYRFVAIANAVDQFDAHGKLCEPKGGWSTISVEDETWETRSGICLHFDGLKSPNVRRKSTIFPRLFSQKEITTIKNDFGENSLEWWSYVRGFWAPKGVRNTVLDASLIHVGKAKEKAIWAGDKPTPIAALDPAFSTGGDDCILRFGEIGLLDNHKLGLNLTEIVKIQLIEDPQYPLAYQIVNKTIEELFKRGVKPSNFILDGTSAASTLGDIFKQKLSPTIKVISFGGGVKEGPVSFDDDREAKKVYDRFVTQLWFSAQKVVQSSRLRGLDDETAKEFCSRQYFLKGEKICIEKKDEYKERTGGKSPDRADAASLLIHLFLTDFEEGQMSTNSDKFKKNWKTLVNRFRKTPAYAEI